jgi:hypothetical protein
MQKINLPDPLDDRRKKEYKSKKEISFCWNQEKEFLRTNRLE